MRRLVAACVALAALSLLLPSAPSYDPWAWIAWGREIFELDLNTRTGPSWKPLPVLVTTLMAPIDDASPWVWLVIARAGGMLALVMAARVSRLLVGGPAGWVAGAIAALALLTSADFGRTVAMGYSEGLLVALLLGAVEAHLRDRRGVALWLVFAAALLRPETWPFVGAYGLYLWVREPALRVRLLALAAAVPALWFLPELWGSGEPLRASSRAQEAVGNAPALAEEPARELLRRARWALIAPVEVGVLLAVAGAAVAVAWARGRDHEPNARPVLVLAATAAAWIALVALMTERGYAGNERYLMAPVALACVLSGVGWARAGQLVGRVATGGPRVRAAVPVAATLVLAAIATAAASTAARARADELDRDLAEIDYQAQLSHDLDRVIARAGGPERLRSCGRVVTGDYHVPAVAWRLRLHGVEVGVKPEPTGTVIRAPAVATWPSAPRAPRSYRTVARAGRWEVLMSCGPVSGARARARPPRTTGRASGAAARGRVSGTRRRSP
ncbi:MAG TPA: hypothetical protein VF712_14950 [Thermoleophilaceae bacterium]|jgi:hypothetical protein